MAKALIVDLDGTIYRGRKPIDGARETLDLLRAEGHKIFFLTNSASVSRQGLASKLLDMGFNAKGSECYPTSYIVAKYIEKNYPKKKAYVIGDHGIIEEFQNANIGLTDQEPDIVAVGLDRKYNYEKMSKAYLAIAKGAVFLASNADNTYPIEDGSLPGCGAIVASIECATKKKAYVIGKPNTFPMELIKKENKLLNDDIIVIGDRIDTDVMFAKSCGVKCALVLSGEAKEEDIKTAKPDYVLSSIATLRLSLL